MDLSTKTYTEEELQQVEQLLAPPEDGIYTPEYEQEIRQAFEIFTQKGIPVSLKDDLLNRFPLYSLEYELPEYEGIWEGLTYIDASFGFMSKLPHNISKLKNVEELHLRSNKIKALPPEIGQLSQLHTLDLTKNKLLNLPEEFGNLQSLKSLQLSDNYLQTLPPSFAKLQSLEYLSLQGMKVDVYEIYPEIFELENLQYLELNENKIEQVSEKITNLKNLKTIALLENQLQTLPEEVLRLNTLEKIYLGDNPIKPEEVVKLDQKFGNKVTW